MSTEEAEEVNRSQRKRYLVRESTRNGVKAFGSLAVNVVHWGRHESTKSAARSSVGSRARLRERFRKGSTDTTLEEVDDASAVLMSFPDVRVAAAEMTKMESKINRTLIVRQQFISFTQSS